MTPAPAPPGPRPRPDRQAPDLDQRIQRAERRLIARDMRLRRNLHVWTAQVRAAMRPRRLLMPVLGGACFAWAAWQLVRGPLAPAGETGVRFGASGQHPGAWSRFMALAWAVYLAARRAGLGVSMLKRAASRLGRAHQAYPESGPSS